MAGRTTGRYTYSSSDTATSSAAAVTAKTESQTLVAANSARVGLYITNDGEKTVYLALGATATKNKGIRLLKGDPPLVISNYLGVISVVTAEGEAAVTYAEV